MSDHAGRARKKTVAMAKLADPEIMSGMRVLLWGCTAAKAMAALAAIALELEKLQPGDLLGINKDGLCKRGPYWGGTDDEMG